MGCQVVCWIYRHVLYLYHPLLKQKGKKGCDLWSHQLMTWRKELWRVLYIDIKHKNRDISLYIYSFYSGVYTILKIVDLRQKTWSNNLYFTLITKKCTAWSCFRMNLRIKTDCGLIKQLNKVTFRVKVVRYASIKILSYKVTVLHCYCC